jgi:DHA1 family bicyclomycin/chloramphenicol resistance-like MFS transporter
MSAEPKVAGVNSLVLPLLTALTALGSMSVSIYLPSLPNLATSLHATAASVKLSLTLFLFVFALSQLIYGPLSDRFGRKPPVVAGLLIYLAGSVACATAMNASWLILARMLQGVGAGAGPALGRAILRDLYSGEKLTRSLAAVAAAVALSPMLGPVIGGYLQTAFGWRSNFVFLTGAAVALLLCTYLWLPETHAPGSTQRIQLSVIARNYSILLWDREYISALTCGGMLTAGNFAWTAAAPFIFKSQYRFGPAQYGNIALLIGSGYVAGAILSGQLSRRLAAPAVVYTGMALALSASISLILLAAQTSAYQWAIGLMIVFTAGMGIVIPMSAACALSRHPEIAGSAAGLLGAMQIVTGAFGSLAISFFSSPTITPVAVILTVTSAVSLFAAYIALLPFRSRIISSRQVLA